MITPSVEEATTDTPARTPARASTRASVRWRMPYLQMVLWIIGVAGTLAVLGFILWNFRGEPADDPYITYRYAHNLASGQGFVYNAGEHVQSTTTPLFTILLALGGWAGLDIPIFAYLLNALSLLAFFAACVGYISAYKAGSQWLGLLVALLTFVCPITLFGFGSEMPLLMALSWGAWWAASRERWTIAAVLAALAAVTRGDGVLVGLVIAVFYVYNHRRVSPGRWAWSAAGVYVLVAAPWYLFAWLYFGSPLPATLSTKIAQGSRPETTHFFDGLGVFWARAFGDSEFWWKAALVVGIIGFVYLISKWPALATPWVWATLFVGGYSVLGVPRYPWYYSPLVPVAMLCLAMGGKAVGDALHFLFRRSWARGAGLAGAALVSLVIGWLYFSSDASAPQIEQRPWLDIYRITGLWIDANTPPNATVGSEEIGILGYFTDRRIIDFQGLIQPDVAPHLARNDNLWVLQTYNPDYIVARRGWMGAVGANPWTQEHYTTVRTFELPWSDPITLLKRKDAPPGAH